MAHGLLLNEFAAAILGARAASMKFEIPSLNGIRALAFLTVFLSHNNLNKSIPGQSSSYGTPFMLLKEIGFIKFRNWSGQTGQTRQTGLKWTPRIGQKSR